MGARVWDALARRHAACCIVLAAVASNACAHEVRDSADAALRWLTIVALLVSAALYVTGMRALRRRRHTVPMHRTAAFCAGWSALAIALLSPLDRWGEQLFSAHMLQHELLMLIGAPLLVLGKPLAAFAAAAPRTWRAVAAWPRTWRLLTAPLAAWALHAVVIWLWHAPRLFDASVTHPWVHAAQHASFLFSALIFWYALLIAQQLGMTIVYLLTTAIHTAVLGALLTFAPAPLYGAYAHTTAVWGLTPLEDQQLGGLIMWVPAGFVFLLAGLMLFSRWLDAAARVKQS